MPSKEAKAEATGRVRTEALPKIFLAQGRVVVVIVLGGFILLVELALAFELWVMARQHRVDGDVAIVAILVCLVSSIVLSSLLGSLLIRLPPELPSRHGKEVEFLPPKKRVVLATEGEDGVAAEIKEVVTRAYQVIGDEDEALRWLGTPVYALGYETPMSRLGTPEGKNQVLAVLDQLEHGVL